MANSFDQLNFFKKEVLKEVATRCYDKGVSKDDVNDIALKIIPYQRPKFRCCVYKEREIIRERTYLAMGYAPDGNDPHPGQFVYVLEAACDDCQIHKVRITDNCRKCLFKACVNACHFGAIREGDTKMHIMYDKCKACTMCARACPYGSILVSDRPCHRSCPTGALKYEEDQIAKINEPECINCGQCSGACPFGAISEVSYIRPVIEAMKAGKKVIAMVAPAIVGQYGNVTLPQVYDALKAIGFTDIDEVAFAADMTTKYEAEEALESKKEGRHITTSCCPAFVSYIKMKYPQVYEENTSDVLSPMAIAGRVAREKYGKDAVTVFIGPCVAKKAEKLQPKNIENIDYVLTFEEITAMIAAKGVEVTKMKGEYKTEPGSASGRNFCINGGVAHSLNNYLAEISSDTRLTLKAADGVKNVVAFTRDLSRGLQKEDVLEGMMCEGGCMGGIDSMAVNLFLAKSHADKENKAVAEVKIGDAAEKYKDVKCTFDKKTDL